MDLIQELYFKSINEENDRICADGVSGWMEEFDAEVHAHVNDSLEKKLSQ